jgi:hypothetical protein
MAENKWSCGRTESDLEFEEGVNEAILQEIWFIFIQKVSAKLSP